VCHTTIQQKNSNTHIVVTVIKTFQTFQLRFSTLMLIVIYVMFMNMFLQKKRFIKIIIWLKEIC